MIILQIGSTLCKDCHINLQYNNVLVAARRKYCLKADDNVIVLSKLVFNVIAPVRPTAVIPEASALN